MNQQLSMAAMDLAQAGWAQSGWLSLALALLWAAAAFCLPLAPRRRQGGLKIALIVAGIPVLGWVTYCCGPGLGMIALVLGFAVLLSAPLSRRRARPAMAEAIARPSQRTK